MTSRLNLFTSSNSFLKTTNQKIINCHTTFKGFLIGRINREWLKLCCPIINLMWHALMWHCIRGFSPIQSAYIRVCLIVSAARILTVIPLFYPCHTQFSRETSIGRESAHDRGHQQQEFQAGLPSKCYPGPMLLNFSVGMEIGVSYMAQAAWMAPWNVIINGTNLKPVVWYKHPRKTTPWTTAIWWLTLELILCPPAQLD